MGKFMLLSFYHIQGWDRCSLSGKRLHYAAPSVVGLAETVLKAQAPLAAILESKMAASTLPVAILD